MVINFQAPVGPTTTFKSAAELGLNDEQYNAIVKSLEALEASENQVYGPMATTLRLYLVSGVIATTVWQAPGTME
jgi:hypothetical protein